jgi:hypothetical protein
MVKRIKVLPLHAGQGEFDCPDAGLTFYEGEILDVVDVDFISPADREHKLTRKQADVVLNNPNFVDADTGVNPNFVCAACGKPTMASSVFNVGFAYNGEGPARSTVVDGKRHCHDCFAGGVPPPPAASDHPIAADVAAYEEDN